MFRLGYNNFFIKPTIIPTAGIKSKLNPKDTMMKTKYFIVNNYT